MTKRALIHIDFTNDFVNGALPVGEPAITISERINEITNDFIDSDGYVFFAIDVHKENDSFHPETILFPPHNIEGTSGRELYGELKNIYKKAISEENKNVFWLDKTRYSAFAGTDLEIRLRERDITELHLVGVCTDICVLHTAVDAYNKGFKLVIHEDAVASFDQLGHRWSLEHFKRTLGATILRGGQSL